jgi:hypothetical protein
VSESLPIKISNHLVRAPAGSYATLDRTPRALRDTLAFDVAIPPRTNLDQAVPTLLVDWSVTNTLGHYALYADFSVGALLASRPPARRNDTRHGLTPGGRCD